MNVARPRKKIIIVCGPSGAGKGTVCAHLISVFPEKLRLSVSETTRPPRGAEESGRHYVFVSEKTFQKNAASGHYYEWFKVHNRYYGTPRHAIDGMIEAGQVPVLDIDVQGKERIAGFFPDHLSLFIVPPSMDVLRERLTSRSTDRPDEIKRRIRVAQDEMAAQKRFQHVILNNVLKDALKKAETIVKAYIYDG